MQLAQSHGDTQWKSWESTSQTLPSSPKLRVRNNLTFVWLKKIDPVRPKSNTASLTAHEYVRNPVLYTANRVKGGFLNQRTHKSERAHP